MTPPRKLPALLLLTLTTVVAEESWTKVRELRSGSDVRIYQRGVLKPLIGQLDEVHADSVVVIVKNEQSAIARDQIDRLDSRPANSGPRTTREIKTTIKDPSRHIPLPGPGQGAPVPSASSASHITFGSKADFETVYRRPPLLR